MRKEVIVDKQGDNDIVIIGASEDDIDTIDYALNNPDEINDLIFPDKVNMDNIIGYGKCSEVLEDEAKQIIPVFREVKIKGVMRQQFRCFIKFDPALVDNYNIKDFHYTALSTLKCAFEVLNKPKYFIVFKKPINKNL